MLLFLGAVERVTVTCAGIEGSTSTGKSDSWGEVRSAVPENSWARSV